MGALLAFFFVGSAGFISLPGTTSISVSDTGATEQINSNIYIAPAVVGETLGTFLLVFLYLS